MLVDSDRQPSTPSNPESIAPPKRESWCYLPRDLCREVERMEADSGIARAELVEYLLRKGMNMPDRKTRKAGEVVERTIIHNHSVRNGDINVLSIRDSFNDWRFSVFIDGSPLSGLTLNAKRALFLLGLGAALATGVGVSVAFGPLIFN